MMKKVIEECFYKDLKFGTGGIRAIMGLVPINWTNILSGKILKDLHGLLSPRDLKPRKKVLSSLATTEGIHNSSVKRQHRS